MGVQTSLAWEPVRVAVANESMARQFWLEGSAIGMRSRSGRRFAAVLVCIALAASYAPARRPMRADVAGLLRYQPLD
jgi:hypothetical protein